MSNVVTHWDITGPRVLAWLRAEVPRRSTVKGLAADCARALGPPLRGPRLQDWLHESVRAEWVAIKRTLGTGVDPAFVQGGNGNGHRVAAVAPAPSSAPPCSLDEYAREKLRATCPVCALPAATREILAGAGDKGHKVALQVDWLKVKCGVQNIGAAELTAHRNGRHEA